MSRASTSLPSSAFAFASASGLLERMICGLTTAGAAACGLAVVAVTVLVVGGVAAAVPEGVVGAVTAGLGAVGTCVTTASASSLGLAGAGDAVAPPAGGTPSAATARLVRYW